MRGNCSWVYELRKGPITKIRTCHEQIGRQMVLHVADVHGTLGSCSLQWLELLEMEMISKIFTLVGSNFEKGTISQMASHAMETNQSSFRSFLIACVRNFGYAWLRRPSDWTQFVRDYHSSVPLGNPFYSELEMRNLVPQWIL